MIRRAVVLMTVLSGCGVSESTVGETEQIATEASLGSGVQLVEAHPVIGTTQSGEWRPYVRPLQDLGYGVTLTSLARGLVSVDAPKSDSRVFIHFMSKASNEPDGAWKVVEARRIDTRRWEFATTPATIGAGFHYIPRFVHRFAIEHRTAQGSQWDNNGGQDYVVSGDDDGGWVPVWAGPSAVLRNNVVVEQATWDGAMLRGSVIVRNIGYGKRLNVIATTTAWATQHVGVASWVKQFSNSDLERWTFEVVAPATDTELVQFAVSLDRPDGVTEWDNNADRNYRLRLDGVDSPWALGPVRRPGRLVFEANNTVRLERAPAADGAFTLVYDPARLPKCRGTKYGRPAWGLVAFVGTNGQFTQTNFEQEDFTYPSGHLHTKVLFASGHDLATYFLNTDVSGCQAYDSNFGQNFVFRW